MNKSKESASTTLSAWHGCPTQLSERDEQVKRECWHKYICTARLPDTAVREGLTVLKRVLAQLYLDWELVFESEYSNSLSFSPTSHPTPQKSAVFVSKDKAVIKDKAVKNFLERCIAELSL